MPNQPASKSGKIRVGTVKCPMTGEVCDVYAVRLGNRHAEKLYYRHPAIGTIQCYGHRGQAWLREHISWEPGHGPQPEKVPARTGKKPAAPTHKVQETPAEPVAAQPSQVGDEQDDDQYDVQQRFLKALGGAA